jgi:hypothetical protein
VFIILFLSVPLIMSLTIVPAGTSINFISSKAKVILYLLMNPAILQEDYLAQAPISWTIGLFK